MSCTLNLNGAQVDALCEVLYASAEENGAKALQAHDECLREDDDALAGDWESDVYAYASNAARLARLILALDDE